MLHHHLHSTSPHIWYHIPCTHITLFTYTSHPHCTHTLSQLKIAYMLCHFIILSHITYTNSHIAHIAHHTHHTHDTHTSHITHPPNLLFTFIPAHHNITYITHIKNHSFDCWMCFNFFFFFNFNISQTSSQSESFLLSHHTTSHNDKSFLQSDWFRYMDRGRGKDGRLYALRW